MSDSRTRIVEITDQNSLWDSLEEALSASGTQAPFLVDFSRADWAKIRIVYSGPRFHASITPTVMRGILELQASLYRSAAVILRNEPDIRKLPHSDREALELVFTVKGGSADTESEGKGFLSKLAEAASTMESKHKLIGILVLAAMYFGASGFTSYLHEKGVHEERSELVGLSEHILEHDERAQALLAKSQRETSEAREIQEQALLGLESVVRNLGDVSSVTIQGTTLSREAIDTLTSTSRRTPRNVTIRDVFEILSVDTTTEGGFSVRLRSVNSGKVFSAALYDSLASDRTRKTIQRAEWNKQNVALEIFAREVGSEIIDARVLRSITLKAQKLDIIREIRT